MEKDNFSIGQTSAEWAERAQLATHYAESLASTNELAKENCLKESQNIKLYFTDFQTAGRGRGQNQWISPLPGQSLQTSWSFALSRSPQPIISILLGLALYRAVLATWPSLPWSLKAPNDLFLGDKKVAGILLETVSQGDKTRLIFGLGFNIFNQPELGSATHLSSALDENQISLSVQDWCQFLDRLLLELTMTLASQKKELDSGDQAALIQALNKNPVLSEKFFRIEGNGTLIRKSGILKWSDL